MVKQVSTFWIKITTSKILTGAVPDVYEIDVHKSSISRSSAYGIFIKR